MILRAWISLLLISPLAMADNDTISTAIATIRAVAPEGKGNDAAAAAWKNLTAAGLPALVPTLEGFQGANVMAANWLRSAVDAIAESEAKSGRKLPAETLGKFAEDVKQNADARRIAFELFEKQKPDAAKEMLAKFVDDPSLDLRRDAIARQITLAGSDLKRLEPLFASARDRDQVEELAKLLKKDEDDIVKHFNFVTKWHIVGPFDGPKASGFATTYTPEEGVDLKASYKGKTSDAITWKAVDTNAITEAGEKDYCLVDLAKEIGKHKDSVAYAYAVVEVPGDTPLEFRGATQNGIKFFLNGKKVFEREAYHQGTMMDQHHAPCVLKAGRNELLVKICQNDQKEPWAQRWAFQLRLCDRTGGRVPFTLVSPEAK